MDVPKVIYKYQALNLQNLRNLKDSVLYFASPEQFNDPYDCAIKPDIKKLSDQDANKIIDCLQKELKARTNIKNELNKDDLHKIVEDLIENKYKDNKKGVSCFSEEKDNHLLWAHYADSYKGFCLGFNTQHSMFQGKVHKVIYTNKAPQLCPVKILTEDDLMSVLEALYWTKKEHWGYEKEWRCIHEEQKKAYTYDKLALGAVYFGPKIDPVDLEIICLILQGQNEQVDFYEGKVLDNESKLIFEKFNYTNHLNAKKRGLIK